MAIPDAQKDFIEGFMTLAARIGDDIDDDDALEEVRSACALRACMTSEAAQRCTQAYLVLLLLLP